MQRIVGFCWWSVTLAPFRSKELFMMEGISGDGLFREGFFDTFFQRGEGGGVTGGAEAHDVRLSVMLVAVLEVAGHGDVFNLAGTMDLHEGFGNRLEGAGFASTGVHY